MRYIFLAISLVVITWLMTFGYQMVTTPIHVPEGDYTLWQLRNFGTPEVWKNQIFFGIGLIVCVLTIIATGLTWQQKEETPDD